MEPSNFRLEKVHLGEGSYRGGQGSLVGTRVSVVAPPHMVQSSKDKTKEALPKEGNEATVYTLEVAPDENVGQMPQMFTRDCYGIVPNVVTFKDPQGNVIELGTSVQGRYVFLNDGWKYLREYYKLLNGGWIDMVWDRKKRFDIRVYGPDRKEIKYPKMPQGVIPEARQGSLPSPIGELPLKFTDTNKLKFRLVKWLTYDEVTGNTLLIERDWAYKYLPTIDGYVTIVDENGRKWNVFLKHDVGVEDKCGLTNGWANFCLAKQLKQEQKIMFGVFGTNARELYFLPSW